MKVLGVIPSRYQSTRFPGKPLVLIEGVPMIVKVFRQASLCKQIDHIIVATDSEKIQEVLENFGIPYLMTSAHHLTGTDRCVEVVQQLHGFDIVLNIQGDEPFIQPEQLDLVIDTFQNKNVEIATLIKKIEKEEELHDPNIVKVVKNVDNKALYFSRSAIPFIRNIAKEVWHSHFDYYKHIGIYAFKTATLLAIKHLKPSDLENAESLEQLRWIENGLQIYVNETTLETIGIDTPEDLIKIKNL
jgi:3-deoxy-manno-octulosonate cytidylyltransferase (CMP-KDO synthetase)